MAFVFVPGPPRLLARYCDGPIVELARGPISDEDLDELTEQMGPDWTVWEDIPWDRTDPEECEMANVVSRPHPDGKSRLQFTQEEKARLEETLRLPFNPDGCLPAGV